MLHLLCERIAVFLFDRSDEYPLEIYTYGMELIVSSAMEFVTLIAIGIVFSKLVETIIFILAFSFIRFFTGGYHSKTYLRCAVVTVVTYLFVLVDYELLVNYASKYVICLSILVFLISLFLILKFATLIFTNPYTENIFLTVKIYT